MLILVAGITGFVGAPIARAALARGHKVRGLARNIDSVPKDIYDQLEGFEVLSDLYDGAAMQRAVTGVDAVVNANAGLPELILESQLLLLRAAEHAAVKIFHGSSWNYDWRRSNGTHEGYDVLAAFAHYVDLTSDIKPIYMFTGAIVEFYFRKSLINWDGKTKTFSFYGPSTFPTRYTTTNDIANYVLEAITAPDAAEGGDIRVQSFEASPEDLAKAYSAARDGRAQMTLNCLGTVEDAKAKLDEGRATHSKREWYKYNWYTYQQHIPSRTWDYEPVDVARFANVKQTSTEEFFRQNPDI
ncbi:NmrA-like protein [Macrophomina phaseolina MS6]|uniref:NmrA-like protein n=1 Tax=Macrophomina phaseolina (strain MS6) TaxID=1126212 RepID=K2RZ01_MACPH|nr:NmrA-like protein [Macrophomina phaseolina MS6]